MPTKKKIPAPRKSTSPARLTAEYRHKEETPARPDVGTQPQFKKRAPPKTYRYDSSLAPDLAWDSQNPAREQGEALIAALERRTAALRSLVARLPSSPGRGVGGEGKAAGSASKTLADIQAELQATDTALKQLKGLSRPFLNWTGKAERLSFDVPTLPLFVHERLSTQAILETLKGHRRDKQLDLFDLFSDPQRPIHEQVLRAYEYQDKWVNRMILGDSLVVMNSLLHYESMGGQVQMIYMDPPYGVKFGSNFQPFVRKRDVSHGDDEDMTREPEMVQAYRDTWELGLHSYLTYLRDRLLLSRELLTASGSIFVQISDENLHHVREVIDEVFGAENFCALITFAKTTSATSELLSSTSDYLIWYAKDLSRVKYHQVFLGKVYGGEGASAYTRLLLEDGSRRPMTAEEKEDPSRIPKGARIYRIDNLTSQRPPGDFPVELGGKSYRPNRGYWKTGEAGMEALKRANRLESTEGGLYYVRFFDDFPVFPISNRWSDTSIAGFASDKLYVVQTTIKVVQRCVLMTTDPGDVVLDPTCGSGTTAYVAEHWGRRWITVDTSRVPLALARQRLLTATFPWYDLKDQQAGPTGGLVYKRRQNAKGEEVGGIVPHIMLSNIANNEPAQEEVIVDRPEESKNVTRVSGPFVFEASIPPVMDVDFPSSPTLLPEGEGSATRPSTFGRGNEGEGDFVDRMLEVLRRSPVLRLEGNRTVTLKNVRRPAKTLSLSAEATIDLPANGKSASITEAVQAADEANRVSLPFSQKPIAIVFGPENGAVAEKLVWEAAREAKAKDYDHLYVIGFAIQPPARQLVESSEAVTGIAATYVQATPDLMMGDLLKNMRSSQIFSVCGLPEIELRKSKRPEHLPSPHPSPGGRGGAKGAADPGAEWYEVELLGLDVFDPMSMDVDHKRGDDVPAWFLDSDYNGLSFHVCQAFFPRTAAWDNLKRALKGEYDDSVWQHLAKNVSVPFEAGEHQQVAVKVIDDRGNELMVVKSLKEAR